MTNEVRTHSLRGLLLTVGAMALLVGTVGCSTANTLDAVDNPGAVGDTASGSGAMQGATRSATITITNELSNKVPVVVYQRGVATGSPVATAWTVAQIVPSGDSTVEIPSSLEIREVDSYGNNTPNVTTAIGQQWSVQLDSSGIVPVPTSQASTTDSIEAQNNLAEGSATIDLLLNGKVLASSTITLTAIARFTPSSSYYLDIAPAGLEQGDVMNEALLNSLDGIAASVEPGQHVVVEIQQGSGASGPVFSVVAQPN